MSTVNAPLGILTARTVAIDQPAGLVNEANGSLPRLACGGG